MVYLIHDKIKLFRKKKKKGNYKFQKAKPNQTVNSSNCRASSTF